MGYTLCIFVKELLVELFISTCFVFYSHFGHFFHSYLALLKPKVQREAALAPKKAAAPVKPVPAVVSTLQSSGTVVVQEQATAVDDSTGPRQAGARRSAERARGKKRKGTTTTTTTPSDPPSFE
jgi:hypothetical protein